MEPSDPVNPYEPPRAELEAAPATRDAASLENATAGRYDFRVGEVIDEAWQLVNGMKATFWGAAIVVGLIYLVLNTICGVVVGLFIPVPDDLLMKQIYKSTFNMIAGALAAPLTMGMQMMCVRRALDQPISFATAFAYFSKAPTVLAGAFLGILFTALGFALLIIPGIYLTVAYQFTNQLIGDHETSATEALQTSRAAISHRWWSVFGLNLAVGLLTFLSALGFIIPLIWTIPWAMMTTGVLYKRIFRTAQPASPAAPT